MKAMNGIAKPPMRPALLAAAASSIGNGRRGECVKTHAVQRTEGAPTMLYKYCSVATAEKIFRDGAVLLKAAAGFNDPFEMNCRIHWPDDDELRRRIGRQFPTLSEPKRTAVYEDALRHKREFGDNLPPESRGFILQNAGVSCFSETRESILMWSHYADEHKGVCIGFSAVEMLQSLLAKPVTPPLGGGIRLGAVPCVVQYKDALPVWEGGRSESVGDVVATKARCWAYEREWRIFALLAAGKKQELLPETFGRVIFGARAAENDKKRLARLIAKRHPSVKFLQAEISRTEYKVEFSDHHFCGK